MDDLKILRGQWFPNGFEGFKWKLFWREEGNLKIILHRSDSYTHLAALVNISFSGSSEEIALEVRISIALFTSLKITKHSMLLN